MFLDSFKAIIRAAWVKAAAFSDERTQSQLIKSDKQKQYEFHSVKLSGKGLGARL
jgi:hypothetical protein